VAESRTETACIYLPGQPGNGELVLLGESPYGLIPQGVSSDLSKVVLWEEYTLGDSILYLATLKE